METTLKLRDHLGKLEYFCAVVETGSLKKASQKALVGQPQLSKVIQQLEHSLGAELFIRSHRGVKLTSSGQQLYDFALDVLNKSDEVELDLKASDLALSGRIRFGTYDSISRYFFPDFLKYIKKVAPKLNVDLETGRSEKIRKRVLSGDIDIAVIVGQLTESRKMKSEVIYSDSFGLYQASGLDDYFSDHLIYFPSTDDHSVFEKVMRTYKFKNKIVCDNLETVKSLTEEGIGVGLT